MTTQVMDECPEAAAVIAKASRYGSHHTQNLKSPKTTPENGRVPGPQERLNESPLHNGNPFTLFVISRILRLPSVILNLSF